MEKYYAQFLKEEGYSEEYITKTGVPMLMEQHNKYVEAGFNTTTARTCTEFWFFMFPKNSDEVSEMLYIMGTHYKVAHHPEFGRKAIQDLKEYYSPENCRVTGLSREEQAAQEEAKAKAKRKIWITKTEFREATMGAWIYTHYMQFQEDGWNYDLKATDEGLGYLLSILKSGGCEIIWKERR